MADAVRIEGLASLRRDLRAMQPAARKEVTKALKEGAKIVAQASGPLAARKTGTLAGSFKAGAAGNSAFVRSRVPYAAVQEFGGTIKPKGTPFTIRANPSVTRALELKEDAIVEKVGDAIDVVARRHGW